MLQLINIGHVLYGSPVIVLKALYLSQLILTITIKNRFIHYSHFINKGTEASVLSNHSAVTHQTRDLDTNRLVMVILMRFLPMCFLPKEKDL